MIRERTKDDSVKVCDICKEPKTEYAEDTNMAECFVCGKDLCPKCASYLGDDRTRAWCPEHQRVILKFMSDLRITYLKQKGLI